MSTKLLLVRHGESLWNAEGRIQGQVDGPLSARGKLQALALARALGARNLAAVYSSPLLRALETACAICQPHGLEPIVEPALQEINLGGWQGHRAAELEADPETGFRSWQRNPAAVVPPDGETLDRAAARAAQAVTDAAKAHSETVIAIVTHSIVGRLLLCTLLQAGPDLVPRLKLKQASISTIRLNDHSAILEGLSDESHLRSASSGTLEPILD